MSLFVVLPKNLWIKRKRRYNKKKGKTRKKIRERKFSSFSFVVFFFGLLLDEFCFFVGVLFFKEGLQ